LQSALCDGSSPASSHDRTDTHGNRKSSLGDLGRCSYDPEYPHCPRGSRHRGITVLRQELSRIACRNSCNDQECLITINLARIPQVQCAHEQLVWAFPDLLIREGGASQRVRHSDHNLRCTATDTPELKVQHH